MPMKDWSNTLSLVTAVPLQPLTIELDSQQTPVKGVLVDNSASTIDVYIYKGTSPNANPVIVPAGYLRALPVQGTSALYLKFVGVPSANGSIYVYASSEPMLASDTQVVKVTGPITIGGTVSVDGTGGTFPVTAPTGGLPVDASGHTIPVDGTGHLFPVTPSGTFNVGVPAGVAVTNTPTVNASQSGGWNFGKTGDYPSGASALQLIFGPTSIGSNITLINQSFTSGQRIFLTQFATIGFAAQDLSFKYTTTGCFSGGGNANGFPVGKGDVNFTFPIPIVAALAGSSALGTIVMTTTDTIIGTQNVWVIASGYIL